MFFTTRAPTHLSIITSVPADNSDSRQQQQEEQQEQQQPMITGLTYVRIPSINKSTTAAAITNVKNDCVCRLPPMPQTTTKNKKTISWVDLVRPDMDQSLSAKAEMLVTPGTALLITVVVAVAAQLITVRAVSETYLYFCGDMESSCGSFREASAQLASANEFNL